jgi:hypothetical protein
MDGHFYNQVPDSTNMAGPGSAAVGLPYDNCAWDADATKSLESARKVPRLGQFGAKRKRRYKSAH